MKVRKLDEMNPIKSKDGSLVREIFHPKNSDTDKQSLAEAIIEPGQETKKHSHSDAEEIYYILKGEGIIHIGEESTKVKKNNAILIPPENPHRVKNTSEDKNLVILCSSSPPYQEEDTTLRK